MEFGLFRLPSMNGGMAERTIATVLKTVEVQASGGSNPPPSAFVGLEMLEPTPVCVESETFRVSRVSGYRIPIFARSP